MISVRRAVGGSRFSICCIADVQSAGLGIGPTRGRFPTVGRVQLCDTAQRGGDATKHSLSSIGWRRGLERGGGPSPRSSPHSCVVGRGRRRAHDKNRRSPRRFGQILREYHSGLRWAAKQVLAGDHRPCTRTNAEKSALDRVSLADYVSVRAGPSSRLKTRDEWI